MENNPLLRSKSENNSLLRNKPGSKYNPDVIAKYELMKKSRCVNLTVSKQKEPFQQVSTDEKAVKINEVLDKRKLQDLTFSKIFSKENYIRNKLVHENRIKEVAQIARNHTTNTFQNLKSPYT